jgi:hypothetical protein
MRGGRQHAVVVIGEDPVLLGLQLEVLDATYDRVVGGLRQDLDAIAQVVVPA